MLEPGWAIASRHGLDRETKIYLLETALASMSEGSSPHSTTVGYPAVTVGPPGWRDNNLARRCEIEYDQLRERFIRFERLRWFIRTASSWRSFPNLSRPVTVRSLAGVDADGKPLYTYGVQKSQVHWLLVAARPYAPGGPDIGIRSAVVHVSKDDPPGIPDYVTEVPITPH